MAAMPLPGLSISRALSHKGYEWQLVTLVELLRPSAQVLPLLHGQHLHQPPPLSLALTTCLSLSAGEDLTADARHAGNGAGNDRSCSEGAQDLGLSPEGSSTDLWVEEEPCSEAMGRERA